MAFKAQEVKKGVFDIHGLEEFIERKILELTKKSGPLAEKSAKKEPMVKKAVQLAANNAKKQPVVKMAAGVVGAPLDTVLAALDQLREKPALVKAGKQKDQLLRSLIPLYVARNANVEVSSGVTSKFWAKFGVKYAAPNAAKALREHTGYAKRTKNGNQITSSGIKYVEAALSAKS